MHTTCYATAGFAVLCREAYNYGEHRYEVLVRIHLFYLVKTHFMDTQQTSDQTQNTGGVPPQPTPAPVTVDNTMLMGILSYLGPLVIVPLLTAKEQPFVKFHVKQGLVLAVIEIGMWIIGSMIMIWILAPLFMIINIGVIVLSIIGILNVLNKKEASLPLVGGFAKHFTI